MSWNMLRDWSTDAPHSRRGSRTWNDGLMAAAEGDGAGDGAGGGAGGEAGGGGEPEGGQGAGGAPAIDPAALANVPLADLISDPELARHPSIADYKGVDGLVKSHAHLQKMLGGNEKTLLRMPQDPADEKAWSEFYTKLGRPESPDSYAFDAPEGVELDKLGLSEDAMKELREVAHKNGITGTQATELFQWFARTQHNAMTQSEEQLNHAIQDAEKKLKSEWGNAYDDNVSAMQRALREWGSDELAQVLDQTGLGNHPALANVLAEAGKLLREDTTAVSGGGGQGGPSTPKQAQAQIAAKMADPEFYKRLTDPNHPGHELAMRERDELYRMAYPQS